MQITSYNASFVIKSENWLSDGHYTAIPVLSLLKLSNVDHHKQLVKQEQQKDIAAKNVNN